jgi:hypothetical protein
LWGSVLSSTGDQEPGAGAREGRGRDRHQLDRRRPSPRPWPPSPNRARPSSSPAAGRPRAASVGPPPDRTGGLLSRSGLRRIGGCRRAARSAPAGSARRFPSRGRGRLERSRQAPGTSGSVDRNRGGGSRAAVSALLDSPRR